MKLLIRILISGFFFKMEGFKVVLLILSVSLMSLIEASTDNTTQTEGTKAGKSKLLLFTFFQIISLISPISKALISTYFSSFQFSLFFQSSSSRIQDAKARVQ